MKHLESASTRTVVVAGAAFFGDNSRRREMLH